MHVQRLMSAAVAVPVIYFGVQVAAAPFYPGYSFISRDASTLGSPGSTAPWIFNDGTLVLALVTATAAAAFVMRRPSSTLGRGLATLTGLALASAALGSLNAFLHPLPDPRHTEGWLSLLGGGVLLLPLVMSAILWRAGARPAALVTVLAFIAMIPLTTGLVQRICMRAGIDFSGYQWFLNTSQGLIQRAAATVVFVPVAVAAYLLQREDAREDRRR
jgi:hypothetical protein